MPPSAFNRLTINPPLLNTACAWASDYDDLKALYECPHTGAITTRTATLEGFPDDPQIHKVVFLKDSQSSINSYGYSPYPLRQYIEWIDQLLTEHVDSNKPIIISIAVSLNGSDADPAFRSLDVPDQESEMLDMAMPRVRPSNDDLSQMIHGIQVLRKKHRDSASPSPRIAIEINTSCPNLAGHPPPAYEPDSLRPILGVVSRAFWADPSLAFGLKLPPYVHARSFVDVVDFLASFSKEVKVVVVGDGTKVEREKEEEARRNPIAFLTCTNTLGSTLVFEEQAEDGDGDGVVAEKRANTGFELPSVWGGLAGEAIHPLALGNVHSFSKLLKSHQDEALRDIAVIGVGGVTSAAAARRMVAAGASAVGCATIFGKKGVAAFEDIVEAFK